MSQAADGTLDVINVDNFAYRAALRALGTLRPDPEEACALVAGASQQPSIEYAGEFLSAAFNRSLKTEIVYRGCGDVPIEYVGNRLHKAKTLVIPSDVYKLHVDGSYRGTIVLEGNAGYAGASDGILLVSGKVGFVPHRGDGVLVVSGAAESISMEGDGLVIVTGSAGSIKDEENGSPAVLVGPDASVQNLSIGTERNGFAAALAAPRHHSFSRILTPERIRNLPGLRAYLDDLLAPFAPGTDWRIQHTAARKLAAASVLSDLKKHDPRRRYLF